MRRRLRLKKKAVKIQGSLRIGWWIPTRSATPSTALVPQRKVGFPIPNTGLLLRFQGTKTARREGISSPFSDAGGCTSPQNSGFLERTQCGGMQADTSLESPSGQN